MVEPYNDPSGLLPDAARGSVPTETGAESRNMGTAPHESTIAYPSENSMLRA